MRPLRKDPEHVHALYSSSHVTTCQYILDDLFNDSIYKHHQVERTQILIFSFVWEQYTASYFHTAHEEPVASPVILRLSTSDHYSSARALFRNVWECHVVIIADVFGPLYPETFSKSDDNETELMNDADWSSIKDFNDKEVD